VKSAFRTILLIGLMPVTLCPPTLAQEAPIEFRMVPAAGNMVDCSRLDAPLSRVHTVTPMGDRAHVKSAGGINDTLKQTKPGIFESTVSLGSVTLFVVADAAKTPRTLDVTEKSLGCRWNAVAK
jgi:hypothetical protein